MVTRVRNAKTTPASINRRRKQSALHKLADFESVLSEMSASFVRVSVDQIDSEVERWLGQIALTLEMDRGTIGEFNQTDQGLYVTHQWAREGVTKPDVGLDVRLSMPWTYRQLLSGKLLAVSRLEEFPPKAAEERRYARLNGGACTLAIPMKVGEAVVGAVSFGKVGSERKWTKQIIKRLRLSAEIFSNALERKRSEAEIGRLSEELQHVSQVVALGELTDALADEFRQPLTAIMSNSEALLLMLTTEQLNVLEIETTARDILAETRRAAEIVRDVHALFGRSEAQKSLVDFKDLLRDVRRIASPEARRRNASLKFEVADSLPSVQGNRIYLTRAVLNLVINALDSVCVGKGPREVGVRAVIIGDELIRVTVQDSGKGIDPKTMKNLFEPLTTRPLRKEMGLAIARSIVQNHGGRIWAKQNAGPGAILEFELPIEQPQPS
jgi:signal transduction histidine kinase